MMKKNIFLLLITATTVTMNLQAQVKIGEDKTPEQGALLDLNSAFKGGLLLPNVSITNVELIPTDFTASFTDPERDENLDLTGMIVYNTFAYVAEGRGVYVWDGYKWAAICAEGKKDGAPMPIPVGCTTGVPEKPVVWMTYNLGAATSATINITGTDVHYDLTPPKGQMKWLTDKAANGGVGFTDATVYGDLYQWGRRADGHEKRNSTISSVRPISLLNEDYSNGDGTGQIINPTYIGQLIYSDIADCDWQKVNVYLSNLWGNGKAIDKDTSPNGNPYNDGSGVKYFQGAVKAPDDPCPSGWRVPTQDEWETLGDYCDSHTAGGTFYTSSNSNSTVTTVGSGKAAIPAMNPNLVWVTVVKGLPNSVWPFSNTTTEVGGYALYDKTEWEDSKYADYRAGTKPLYDEAAPVPLLFLPAAGGRGVNGYFTPLGVGYWGCYWSSTVCSTRSHYLFFDKTYVDSGDGSLRGSAQSVRCVAEIN
jgi:uncharacterized protein (TIGR02145 family)